MSGSASSVGSGTSESWNNSAENRMESSVYSSSCGGDSSSDVDDSGSESSDNESSGSKSNYSEVVKGV